MSVAQICASHGDAGPLRRALLDEIARAVPFDAFAWLLTDPVTQVGIAPIAEVPCLADLPTLIRLKYATALNRWTTQSDGVVRLHDATDGDLHQSLVWREFLVDYGVTDIMSIVFRDRSGCWAFLDLWRLGGVFTDAEAQRMDRWVDVITAALRRCVVECFDGSESVTAPDRSGPVVLLLSAELDVRAQTPDTDHYLRALIPPSDGHPPIPAAAYNVAAQLLAVEHGVDTHPPVARVNVTAGQWATVRAARIGDSIAVSIEGSSTKERLDLLCRSADLTGRETEVLDHLVTGADTVGVARRMYLSPHTVQDHLKSIFDKTGSHSRRDLLARVGR